MKGCLCPLRASPFHAGGSESDNVGRQETIRDPRLSLSTTTGPSGQRNASSRLSRGRTRRGVIMPPSYAPLDRQSASSSQSSSTRNLLLAVSAFVATFLVLSLSAHRNAPSSPSAQRAANYLPAIPLSKSTASRDDYSLAYRHQLELSTTPSEFLTHSPTLTFSNIYVLSLPSRQDRRDQIQRVADALGLKIEFVDAKDKEDPIFGWIAQRVKETRKLRKKIIVSRSACRDAFFFLDA